VLSSLNFTAELILFEQVGLILLAPLPFPFTAYEGESEAVKLGHFHSLLHVMNSDGYYASPAEFPVDSGEV